MKDDLKPVVFWNKTHKITVFMEELKPPPPSPIELPEIPTNIKLKLVSLELAELPTSIKVKVQWEE